MLQILWHQLTSNMRNHMSLYLAPLREAFLPVASSLAVLPMTQEPQSSLFELLYVLPIDVSEERLAVREDLSASLSR